MHLLHSPPPTFKTWERAGITTISDLYSESVFASFQQFVDKIGLPRQDFFGYLQIRDYVQTHVPSYKTMIHFTIREIVRRSPYSPYLISDHYKLYERAKEIRASRLLKNNEVIV